MSNFYDEIEKAKMHDERLDYDAIVKIMDSKIDYDGKRMMYIAGIIIACAYCGAISRDEFNRLSYLNYKKHFDYKVK